MTDTNYIYGTTVVEFFRHSEEELQALIDKKVEAYHRHSMSPAYPQLGVNTQWFSDKPLSQALQDLTVWMLQGYTVATAYHAPLYLQLQLRKPESIIESDYSELAEAAEPEYQESRYQRNVAETARQIEITVSRKAQEAAEQVAKQVAKRQVTEEEKALADLLKAYSKPALVKAEQPEVAA